MKHELGARFFASMVIVASLAARDAADNGWRGVIESLLEEPGDSVCEVQNLVSAETLASIRERHPRYVAFVLKPEEVGADAIRGIRAMMCAFDDDPFDDAIWGIVTGPSAEAAKRVALCEGPREVSSVLATTGVDAHLVDGPITVISDAAPPAEDDTSGIFADAWDRDDPDLLLTSSHASERNLEMPFSRGNIVSVSNRFFAVGNVKMIDYSTGQAVEGVSIDSRSIRPLAAPRREKVWLAAGNCLIANHKPDGSDMIMSALGFGKVNQFVGYIKTTWFGDIGWNTWGYFGGYGLALNESWYAANQHLIKRLAYERDGLDQRTVLGLAWDFDGTAFYGNPRRRVTIPGREKLSAYKDGDLPQLIIFPDSKHGRRLVSAPEGFEVFVMDDFALVTKWPELSPDWRTTLVFD